MRHHLFLRAEGSYRAAMAEEWLRSFKVLKVPHTDAPNLITTLGDPVKIRSWQVSPDFAAFSPSV